MKIMNCPECGLKITDAQDECPKCQTKIEDIVEDVASEEVVDEVSAVYPEESVEEELLCENCLAPLSEDQNFCQLCGDSASAIETHNNPVTPKTDAEANKWVAALGYVFFFFPFFFGYYRKSKFSKFHANQALALFLSTIVLFLTLLAFKNFVDWLWEPTANADLPLLDLIGTPDLLPEASRGFFGTHGTGAFLHVYLIAMLNLLHLTPFAFMIMGVVNAIQGKKRQLPVIRRFTKFIQ